MFYRRPLGWALPFEWEEYIELPINRDGKRPRPNFWATSVAGTLSAHIPGIARHSLFRILDTNVVGTLSR